MSTRSYIGKQNDDGTILGIYCHFDGYPDNVGRKLQDHYQEPTKIDALLALGDISSLGSELGEKHDFDAPFYDLPKDDMRRAWTRAYGRDRGETGTDALTFANKAAYLKSTQVPYVYLWRDGAWFVYDQYGRREWRTVTDMIREEEAEEV